MIDNLGKLRPGMKVEIELGGRGSSSSVAGAPAKRSRSRSTTTKNTGTTASDRNVASSMPPKTAVPSEWRAAAPAPRRDHAAARTPRMNANDVIRIGRRRTRAACSAARSIDSPCSRSVLRELDHQDRVLAGEADQHDEPDLAEDVVRAARAANCASERAEHRERDDEHDGERQDPALVERRETQEHDDQRQPEQDRRRAARAQLLKREPGPLVAHAVGQHAIRESPPSPRSPGPSSCRGAASPVTAAVRNRL